jgi:hypothetical protein
MARAIDAVLLACAAFIGLTAGLAVGMAVAARSASRAGQPAGWIRSFAALEFAVLAYVVYLLFAPGDFDSRHWWTSLAACEWALCLSIVAYTAGLAALLGRTAPVANPMPLGSHATGRLHGL